tara:strand:+ start:959 stop:1207 length:249 start_codon:yes stop_codon:yes gene_type:complete
MVLFNDQEVEEKPLGILLQSVRLWLDTDGFHPLIPHSGMPDYDKKFCVKYRDIPHEVIMLLSNEDKLKLNNFNKRIKEKQYA